jgi:hypothetical protein
METFRINNSKRSHRQHSFPITYAVPNRPLINSADAKGSVHVILKAADTALGIAALNKWQFGILKEFFVVHGVPKISDGYVKNFICEARKISIISAYQSTS